MVARLEHDTVDAGAQQSQQMLFVVERERFVRGQQRDFDGDAAELARGERKKARIAKRGRHRVIANVGGQPATRLERADAAAQVAFLAQRDKTCARLVEGRMPDDAVDVAKAKLCTNRAAGEERVPQVRIRHGPVFDEATTHSHDPPPVARASPGCRSAQARGHAGVRRPRAVDRCSTARLLVVEVTEGKDCSCGAVQRARLAMA